MPEALIYRLPSEIQTDALPNPLAIRTSGAANRSSGGRTRDPSSLDPAGVRGVRVVMLEDADLLAEGGSDRRRPFRIAEALVIPHRAWYRTGPTPGRWEA
jgi:hypothetical protein